MKVTDFDFFLPKELIAERPLEDRSSSRLLVLHKNGNIEHKHFYDLPHYLNEGDMILVNNTMVFPARLIGFNGNGKKLDILLVKKISEQTWRVLSKGRFNGRLKISNELYADIYDGKIAHFHYNGNFTDILFKYGKAPIPPYLKRQPDELDRERYQTIFAKQKGSIAAPTAGLHFNDKIIKEIISKGVYIRELTLHVGIGTFKPIRTEYVEEHAMDPEHFEIDKKLINEIRFIKSSGKKIISVGTTTTRAIEGYISSRCSVSSKNGKLKGTTDIFIYPGYTFKIVDSLLTNFHLPKSTPLMLASAICNKDNLMRAYKEAIIKGYRFLSYGDAMLIL